MVPQISSGDESNSAEAWTVEYAFHSTHVSGNFGGFGTSLQLREVPCALCGLASAVGFDVWGSDQCPGTALLSYSGYIAAEATTTKRTTSICMEKTALKGYRYFIDQAAVATADSGVSSSVLSNSVLGSGNNQGGLYSGAMWKPGTADANQWYQMDVGSAVSVVGVVTRGHYSTAAWVKSFTVSSSTDDSTWTAVDGGATFVGNTDQKSPVRSMFASAVTTRYVRIQPATWHSTTINLRAAVLRPCADVSSSVECGVSADTVTNSGGKLAIRESGANFPASAGYASNIELTCARCVTQAAAGAVYTHWGSSSCPGGHGTIYTGFVGAGSSTGAGGTSSYMCLTSSMGLDQFVTSDQDAATMEVYGVKFAYVSTADTGSQGFLSAVDGQYAVCSVCQAPGTRSWSLMVAGTQSCPTSDWTADYTGYLMSHSYNAQGRSEYICVDNALETTATLSGVAGGLWQVETKDGLGTSAGGYVDNAEVTCVMCSSSTGPAYVRWGRSTCPAHTTRLFSGYAAGAEVTDRGGGYNYVCLHGTAGYENTDQRGAYTAAGHLYRVEYETSARGLWQWWSMQNADVPCAVCQSTGAATTEMRAGSTACASGWSAEYSGYLVSTNGATKRGEYVCLDAEPEAHASGDPADNSDSAQMVPVQLEWDDAGGNRVAGGYVEYGELGCAVCSKPNPTVSACPAAPAPSHGSVSCSNGLLYASECTYACSVGYVLSGASRRRCLGTSAWDVSAPTCGATTVTATAMTTHWGSGACSSSETLLYNGRVVGASSSITGSGANYLCLPPTAVVSQISSGDESNSAEAWTVEYAFHSAHVSGNFGGFGTSLQLREVPCALCGLASAVGFDVWGSDQCPGTALLSYSGYIAAEATTTKRTTSICMEKTALKGYRYFIDQAAVATADSGVSSSVLSNSVLGSGNNQGGLYSGAMWKPGTADANQWYQMDVGSAVSVVGVVTRGHYSTAAWVKSFTVSSSTDDSTWTAVDGGATFVGNTDQKSPVRSMFASAVTTRYVRIQPATWHSTTINLRAAVLRPCADVSSSVECGVSADTVTNSGGKLAIRESGANFPASAGYASNIELTCARCVTQAAAGAVYTHWGSSSCPGGHGTIYTGFVGAGSSTGAGGTSSYMCLTSSMGLDQFVTSDQDAATMEVYGVKFAYVSTADTGSQGFLSAVDGQYAVCSVCQAPGTRSWSLMVAGTQSCPTSDWTADYTGYLMSHSYNAQGRSEYICVDNALETTATLSGVAGGLWQVETKDGLGTSAGGYVDNAEVTCVMCSSSTGPAYVRWGRSTCPAHTTRLFSGYAAGAEVTDRGGGYNYVCLHGTAGYENTDQRGAYTAAGHLYRVEYETSARGLWQWWSMQNADVPCAVCQSTGAATTEMRAGSTACASGWSAEYSGYLVSTNGATKRGEYVCLDAEPEAHASGDPADNSDSAQMVPVQLEWDDAGGNRVAGGYVEYGELGCAVCSKPNPTVSACPAAPAPSHGSVSCSNGLLYASECTYACNVGYVLSGARRRRCLETSAWDVSAPTCGATTVTATAVTTHWGSGACSSSETLLYSGRVVGASSLITGSGGQLSLPATNGSGATDQQRRRVEQRRGVDGRICFPLDTRVRQLRWLRDIAAVAGGALRTVRSGECRWVRCVGQRSVSRHGTAVVQWVHRGGGHHHEADHIDLHGEDSAQGVPVLHRPSCRCNSRQWCVVVGAVELGAGLWQQPRRAVLRCNVETGDGGRKSMVPDGRRERGVGGGCGHERTLLDGSVGEIVHGVIEHGRLDLDSSGRWGYLRRQHRPEEPRAVDVCISGHDTVRADPAGHVAQHHDQSACGGAPAVRGCVVKCGVWCFSRHGDQQRRQACDPREWCQLPSLGRVRQQHRADVCPVCHTGSCGGSVHALGQLELSRRSRDDLHWLRRRRLEHGSWWNQQLHVPYVIDGAGPVCDVRPGRCDNGGVRCEIRVRVHGRYGIAGLPVSRGRAVRSVQCVSGPRHTVVVADGRRDAVVPDVGLDCRLHWLLDEPQLQRAGAVGVHLCRQRAGDDGHTLRCCRRAVAGRDQRWTRDQRRRVR